MAVPDAGISRNRILHGKDGSSALARLDSDVLVQSGARYLIVLLGINDIGFPGAVTAGEIIAGHRPSSIARMRRALRFMEGR